jgi:hypothetical protein
MGDGLLFSTYGLLFSTYGLLFSTHGLLFSTYVHKVVKSKRIIYIKNTKCSAC